MIPFTTFADEHICCPRCGACPELQSETELRSGVEYLTLRCHSCGIVFDAQVPIQLTTAQTFEDQARAKP